MSEQAGNTNSHANAVAGIEKMFGGGEPETPEKEAAETEQPQAEATETTEGQEPAQEAQTQPEEVEVEIDGEKYIVPKKISDRFIHHADYTRKTQDVAEMRRALSAEKEAVQLERAFDKAVETERKQLALIDSQIEQYKKLNWLELEPQQALQARAQYDQLKEMRADMDSSISAKRKDFDGKIKQASEEAIQAGNKYIEQKIKGFDETQKKEIFSYGLNEGYTRDELDRIVDPRIVVTLWKAKQWDSLQASKGQVLNKAAQAAPVIKPGSTQRGPTRVQQLTKNFQQAKGQQAKRLAAEDYFAERMFRK